MPTPKVLHLIEGARRARGVAVVIDVFRAFTVAPLVLSRGARALHVVARIVRCVDNGGDGETPEFRVHCEFTQWLPRE